MTRLTPALPTLRVADSPLRCQRIGCPQLAVLEVYGARGFWHCAVGHDGWVRLHDPDVTPPESRYPDHGLPCNCGCGQAIERKRSQRGGPAKYRLDCARRRELERNHRRAPDKLARKHPLCESCHQRIWRHAVRVDDAWHHMRCAP